MDGWLIIEWTEGETEMPTVNQSVGWYTAREFMDLPVNVLAGPRTETVNLSMGTASRTLTPGAAGPISMSVASTSEIEILNLKEELRVTKLLLAKAHNRCAELLIEKNAYLEERELALKETCMAGASRPAELYPYVPRLLVALDGETFRTESEYLDGISEHRNGS